MKAGKRLKVEEMNRLPGSMLNVLLGAMDYGRIALTRHEGEVILAAPGFAVDAMANVGQEYTATEVIDPAILRRFHIKIEYSFLPPEQEVALLRSRHSTLEREDAETLVRIANTIREAYEYGGGSDLDVDLYVSPAALLNTAELVAGGTSISEAIDLTWAAEVAHTKAKREKVRAVIDQNIRDRRIKGRRKTS
jgi:MoxR-like ATPase